MRLDLVLSSFSQIAICLAWSFTGHELIATIATDLLTSTAASQVHEILDGRPLSSIAAWADTIKWQQRYKFTSQLHYINFADDRPPESCHFQWKAPGGQEVIAAIHNYTEILKHAEDGSWQQSEALRFLVHYTEDMHQPLHLSGKARGGNDVYVHFDGYKTNLHKVWDGLGLMKRMKHVSTDEAEHDPTIHELMGNYHEYIKTLMEERAFVPKLRQWTMCPHDAVSPRFGCPEVWARDVARLNCQYTWPGVVEDGILDAEYWERIERDMVLEVLVMKAAVRLAAILNSIFEYRNEVLHIAL